MSIENINGQPDWHQHLKMLCQQSFIDNERFDQLLFLRNKLFPNNDELCANKTISLLTTSTIRLLIKAGHYLNDWPVVIYCCREYLIRLEKTVPEIKRQQEHSTYTLLLCTGCQHMGLFKEAEQYLKRQLLENYHHQPIIDHYQNLRERINGLPCGWENLCSDTLRLTPLHTCHIKDFFWQYADPDIAELCNLPDFDDEQDWLEWLEECQQTSTMHLFAVNHLHWGFIGSVCLEILKGTGFFYFWLGVDFQRQGFGPQAVSILLDWSQRYLGLRCCFTRAYQDNEPSKRAIQKLSFRPLPLKVAEPYEEAYEEEYIYYWGEEKSDRVLFFELTQYLVDMEADFRVLPLVSSSGWDVY